MTYTNKRKRKRGEPTPTKVGSIHDPVAQLDRLLFGDADERAAADLFFEKAEEKKP